MCAQLEQRVPEGADSGCGISRFDQSSKQMWAAWCAAELCAELVAELCCKTGAYTPGCAADGEAGCSGVARMDFSKVASGEDTTFGWDLAREQLCDFSCPSAATS